MRKSCWVGSLVLLVELVHVSGVGIPYRGRLARRRGIRDHGVEPVDGHRMVMEEVRRDLWVVRGSREVEARRGDESELALESCWVDGCVRTLKLGLVGVARRMRAL